MIYMTPSPNEHTVLHTKNLSIGYTHKNSDLVVASQINIGLKKGELIGLVGANGSGKSTLIRTLIKIQPALKGDIFLNKTRLSHLSNLELAKNLSIVLTAPLISKNLSVTELIALGRQPYTNWIGRLNENDKKAILDALDLVKITHLRHKKCYELSDGQLQKVMIARALAQDTEIIVLDEPTTHLDMYHKAYILKLLQQLTKETQKTILFSSHEIDLAIQLCNSMLVIKDQNVIHGDPCELIQKNIFQSLFPDDLITFDNASGKFMISK